MKALLLIVLIFVLLVPVAIEPPSQAEASYDCSSVWSGPVPGYLELDANVWATRQYTMVNLCDQQMELRTGWDGDLLTINSVQVVSNQGRTFRCNANNCVTEIQPNEQLSITFSYKYRKQAQGRLMPSTFWASFDGLVHQVGILTQVK